MAQKLPTSPRPRKSAQRLFLREKSIRSKNPSLISVSAAIASDSRKMSEYARQLREKQKVRRLYGINEKQFRGYYTTASSAENTSTRMLQILEMRLDNIVYRTGYSSTRPQSRQLVAHGWFKVNDRKVNIPSYQLKVGDVVTPTKKTDFFADKEFDMVPEWLQFSKKGLEVKVAKMPERVDIDPDINEQLIVEFYSR